MSAGEQELHGVIGAPPIWRTAGRENMPVGLAVLRQAHAGQRPLDGSVNLVFWGDVAKAAESVVANGVALRVTGLFQNRAVVGRRARSYAEFVVTAVLEP